MKKTVLILALTFALPSLALAWYTQVEVDSMTGKEIKQGWTMGYNTVDLGWPYGKIRGDIAIRHHPRFGKDAIFTVTGGQISCSEYSPCSLLIRFDENKPARFTGGGPSDHSSQTVFIRDYSRFVSELRKSKRMIIEATFFHGGAHQFFFNTEEFPDDFLGFTKAKPEQKPKDSKVSVKPGATSKEKPRSRGLNRTDNGGLDARDHSETPGAEISMESLLKGVESLLKDLESPEIDEISRESILKDVGGILKGVKRLEINKIETLLERLRDTPLQDAHWKSLEIAKLEALRKRLQDTPLPGQ
jgi:hypothetical protein